MRKIVHLVENLSGAHGGSTSAAFAIANESGGSFGRVIVGLDYGASITATVSPDIELVRISSSRSLSGKIRGLVKVLSWLGKHRKEIGIVEFHNVFTPLFLIGSLWAYFFGLIVVLNPHNSLDEYDLVKKKRSKEIVGYLYLGFLLERCSIIRCATRREWQRLVTYGRRVRKSWALLPIRVDAPCLSDDAQRVGPLTILFCSRLDRKKNVETLLRAASSAGRHGLEFKIIIAGTGDDAYTKELKSLAAHLDLGADVQWAGFVAGAAKAKLFSSADLFVLPSKYENFGIVVVEALCYGLRPVLTSNVFIADHLPAESAAVIADSEARLTQVLLDAAQHPRRYRLSEAVAGSMGQFLLGTKGASHITTLYRECIDYTIGVVI